MIHQSMRKFVKLLKSNHGLTQADVTKLLGYRSTTSLVRMMNNQANAETLNKMAKKLRSSSRITLTEDENILIDDILEQADMMEDEDYSAMLQLREMMRGDRESRPPITLTMAESGETDSLTERYYGVRQMRMLVINCEQTPLLQQLAQSPPCEDFHVLHYLYMDQHSYHTVQAVRALLPILYSGHYEGYSLMLDADSAQHPQGLMRADLYVCDYVTQDGSTRHELVVFQKDTNGTLVENICSLSQIKSMLPTGKPFTPIHFTGTTLTPANYREYCQFWQMLENGRAVYRIKQDIGFEQLPVPVLKKAVLENPLPEPFDKEHLYFEYEAIFRKRQEQMLHNAQPQRHVMKKQGMWQFLKTGRLSDHFWACRTFTMEERAQSVEYLLWQMDHRPDFKVYFLKSDSDLRDDEFLLYDDIGLTIIKPGTNYHLGHGHEETLIAQPEFLAFFRRFYTDSILRYHTLPEAQSKTILKEMLQWCYAQCQAQKS